MRLIYVIRDSQSTWYKIITRHDQDGYDNTCKSRRGYICTYYSYVFITLN